MRDQIVSRFVVGRQLVHLGPRSGARLDHVERASHQRQRAESEEIEFRYADRIEVVLVELDDRATHRRVLDRQVIAEESGRQHESTDVRRAQTRHTLEGRHRREHCPAARVVQIDPQLGRE